MKLKYFLFTIIILLILVIYYIFFTNLRIEDVQSNRSNPFIYSPFGGILNMNWCKNEYTTLSNKENMQAPPMVPGNNTQGIDVSTIDNMRAFLEQMHATASKDEVSDASYNFCTKVKSLATWIDPIIGSVKKQSISDIFNAYGAAANPTPGPLSPPTPPPLPIVNNFHDYIQLLTLVVRGSMMLSLSKPDVNINNKLDLVNTEQKDTLENAYNIGLVDCANAQFIHIRNILEYFHNQKSDDLPTPGDTYNTALVYDSCVAINAAAPKFRSKIYSIFKQPNNVLYSTIPYWATRMRVLMIGAGGGGGGGGYGCHTNGDKHDGGGGGGASGNTGAVICSNMISVTPGSKYYVLIGGGGGGGNMARSGNPGGYSVLAYKKKFIRVAGGNFGYQGNSATCGRDYGQGGKPNKKPIPNMYEGNGIDYYTVSNTIYGNEGQYSNTHPALAATTGGKGANSVTINSVDDVIKSMFENTSLSQKEIMEEQTKSGLNNVHLNCGFGGKGGNGNSGDFKKANDNGGFDLLPPSPGSAGGSGYILVVYYE